MKFINRPGSVYCLLCSGAVLLSTFCMAQPARTDPRPELVFQTGFEGSTAVVQDKSGDDHGSPMEHIQGVDKTLRTKNDWDNDWAGFLKGHFMQVQYTGGDPAKRFARVVPEPGNPANHVLQYWLDDSWPASEGQVKARIQTNVYGIQEGLKEFYQSVRVFLTDDFHALETYPHRITWCTLSEFWNNEWWVAGEPYGFRVTLGVGKPSAQESDLNFILNAEDPGQKEVWNGDNVNGKVPVGKWFTMDYYFKEGNKETGRFWMAITPDGGARQVIFDIHNFTHNTKDPAPNGVTGYNPMKLYTSKEVIGFMKNQGKTLQIYWDDFKLWRQN